VAELRPPQGPSVKKRMLGWATGQGWMAPDFDDARWPRAFEFTDQDVGVEHIPAYTRYPEAFAGARWIWSYNLVFDNLVLARKTVR